MKVFYHKKPFGASSVFFCFVLLLIELVLAISLKFSKICLPYFFKLFLFPIELFFIPKGQEDGYVMLSNLNCLITKNPCFLTSKFHFDFI